LRGEGGADRKRAQKSPVHEQSRLETSRRSDQGKTKRAIAGNGQTEAGQL